LKKPLAIFAGSACSPDQFPSDGLPEVAFLGRSNVGKSSLLNALAGAHNLARVSSTPGRTRAVNFFRVENELYLVDLPGYGYAKVPEAVMRGWEALATSYLVGRDALALCVFLVDARHEPTSADETLKAYLDHHGLPYVVAATKSDKLSKGDTIRRREALARGLGRRALDVLAVSAAQPAGIDDLWRTIRKAAQGRRREASRAQPLAG
jgi:GTP-binding protein